MRGLEIAGRPGREPHQRGGCSPPEVVVLNEEVERPSGVCHSAGHIAPGQGQRGTVHLDHPREAGELVVVDDDHVRRWVVGSLAGI